MYQTEKVPSSCTGSSARAVLGAAQARARTIRRSAAGIGYCDRLLISTCPHPTFIPRFMVASFVAVRVVRRCVAAGGAHLAPIIPVPARGLMVRVLDPWALSAARAATVFGK